MLDLPSFMSKTRTLPPWFANGILDGDSNASKDQITTYVGAVDRLDVWDEVLDMVDVAGSDRGDISIWDHVSSLSVVLRGICSSQIFIE